MFIQYIQLNDNTYIIYKEHYIKYAVTYYAIKIKKHNLCIINIFQFFVGGFRIIKYSYLRWNFHFQCFIYDTFKLYNPRHPLEITFLQNHFLFYCILLNCPIFKKKLQGCYFYAFLDVIVKLILNTEMSKRKFINSITNSHI